MATRMSATGLLVRRRDEHDSRLVRLWLTDAGRALREPVEAERRSLEDKITAGLTETELRQLMAALGKVYESARELL
jgi:DNA-binding MarR family transcriptional regulator